MREAADEFAWIASLRPLTQGDPRALDLADDAAVVPARPGFDLVLSKDAMVEGVHFLAGEAPAIVARRLLRTSLSDLAAKAAEPFGYLLLTAWPARCDGGWRGEFARGLADDGARFAIALLGGDTVSTSGPLVVAATVLGWVPKGRAVKRSSARPGDLVMVCGTVGDGWLGLEAARGEIADSGGLLAAHYRLPEPLLGLRAALLAHSRAAADVSDGLLADAEHVARASGLRVTIDLETLPLSPPAAAWLSSRPDQGAARAALAAGGDDYAIVCAVDPKLEAAFAAAVRAAGVSATTVGRFSPGAGLEVRLGGAAIASPATGWRHAL